MTGKNSINLLQSLTQTKHRPDGKEYFSLSFASESTLVEQTRLSRQEIQCIALDNDIIPERYCRNQTTLSNRDQKTLLKSHVAIVGLGGLGGTVTEILARVGIGKLTLIDGDSFDESNLNRQLLSTIADLGRDKATVAAERVHAINPAVETNAVKAFLDPKNGKKILSDAQLVVDCLDTISDRFVLVDECKTLSIPIVSAAIGGTSGQATAIFPGDPGLRQIYGDPQKAPVKGVEATIGTLSFAAVYMGSVECAEVVSILLGGHPELRKKLFLADISGHTTELVDFG